jgi:predicted nucleic acid-binding Zn ribbon protein
LSGISNERQCAACGKAFRPRRENNARFCSTACRQGVWSRRKQEKLKALNEELQILRARLESFEAAR